MKHPFDYIPLPTRIRAVRKIGLFWFRVDNALLDGATWLMDLASTCREYAYTAERIARESGDKTP